MSTNELDIIGTQLAETRRRLSLIESRAWNILCRNFVKEFKKAPDSLEKVKSLGKIGWTIPSSATTEEYETLFSSISSVPSMGRAFKYYYLKNRAQHFALLKFNILHCVGLEAWKAAISEAFLDFDDHRYRSCTALLLPLIEGITSDKFSATKFYKKKHRDSFFERKLAAAKLGSMNHILWSSYREFSNSFFGSHDTKPPSINRHWLLHGHDIPTSDPGDCLRLFQTIETITYLE